MTQERKDQLLNLLRIAFVIGFAYLYSEGGMHDKWLRRYVAPIELSIGLFVFSRDWRVFLQAPLLMASLCLGYGAEQTWLKVLKRMVFGLATGISSAGYIIFLSLKSSHLWLLASFQTLLVLSSCVIFGAFNQLSSARAEEFTIGLIIALVPMMTVRKRGE